MPRLAGWLKPNDRSIDPFPVTTLGMGDHQKHKGISWKGPLNMYLDRGRFLDEYPCGSNSK